MKSFAARCVVMSVVAATVLLPCSFLAKRNDGGPLFLTAAGVCVIILCALGESLFPGRHEDSFWLSLAKGIGKGALVGLCAWAVLMFLLSILIEQGDKFGIYVVFFSPVPVSVGSIAGGIARFITSRRRKTKSESPPSKEVRPLSRTNGDGKGSVNSIVVF